MKLLRGSSGKIIDIKDGKIFETSVNNVERSEVSIPGEKMLNFSQIISLVKL